MQAKNYEILMDINHGMLNNEIMEIVTGDFGMNHFKVKLLKMKRIPYDLKNTKVRIMVRTPSGSEQQQDCTVEDPIGGTASITFMQSLFTENGMHTAEIQIYDSTTQVLRLTTPRFSYYVRQSLQGDESIIASDDYSLLQDALASVGSLNQQLNEIETGKTNRIGGDFSRLPVDPAKEGFPNSINSDDMNYINQRIFSYTAGTNNSLHVFGNRGENTRRFGIQSGHTYPQYATAYGILELNPFGGEVRSNGKQVATTDKIDILFPFNADFEHSDNLHYRSFLTVNPSLKTCRLQLSLRRKDGGVFAQTYFNIGTIPATYRPKINVVTPLAGGDGTFAQSGVAILVIRTNGTCDFENRYVSAKNFYATVEWDY